MSFYDREEKIIDILFNHDTLRTTELAKQLYISLPTLRRDLIKLEQKGIIRRSYGTVSLKTNSADEKIPFMLRQQEHNAEKNDIAQKASAHIKKRLYNHARWLHKCMCPCAVPLWFQKSYRHNKQCKNLFYPRRNGNQQHLYRRIYDK